MPVSPKRKKDGKPVRRAQPSGSPDTTDSSADSEGAAQPPRAELHVGKPRNPFVAQQGRKASQRGR